MGKSHATVKRPAAVMPRTAVAVLVEGGRRGGAAVPVLVAQARDEHLDVTLIAVHPHADNSGCTMSAEPLNAAVREAAEDQLAQAAATLNAHGIASRQVLLRARADPPLTGWALEAGITTVLLPGRGGPLRRGRTHPAAAGLRRAGIDARVV